MKIVLASNNPGKCAEIKSCLGAANIDLVPQASLGVEEADETGLSFIENALLKARHAALATQCAALADDSGLVVDALDGAPGIYSARYAGVKAGDQANNEKLLAALQEVPQEQRTARFICVIAYLNGPNDPTPLICQGVWEGQILFEPQGDNGFGYDPLFYVPSHQCASAQLSPDVKNKISHRGQALAKLQLAFQ